MNELVKKTFSELTQKQKQGREALLSNKYSEILFDGGSRAGKTFLICLAFIILAMRYQGARFLMARRVYAHAKASIALQTLEPMIRDLFQGAGIIINKSDWIIKIGRSEIWIGGLDNKDRVDKILGQEYAAIFLNEAVDIPEGSRDIVATRLAQNITGFNNFMIYDCNPRHPLHYLYQEFYVQKDTQRFQIHWTPQDNAKNLPDGYINRTLGKLKGDKRARFLKGEWAALPGAVYPGLTAENKIEIDIDPLHFDAVTVGIDFGLHSAVCVWGHKEDRSYCLHNITLLGSKEVTTKNIIKEMDNQIPYVKEFGFMVYADHEPDRIQEIADAGYIVKKAYKDVSAGDSSVNSRELFFNLSCDNTFQSMLNLTHQQDKEENFIDAHVKVNDHEADASRYGIHGYIVDNIGSPGDPVFMGNLY